MEEGIDSFKPSITSTEATATAYSVILKTLVDKSGGISDYGFYFTEGDKVRKIAANNLADNRFSCTITDLTPETRFIYRAFIGNGVSEILSDEQTVTTLKAPAPTDIVDIPDQTLREYVLWHFDSNKDGFLSVAEALEIRNVSIYSDELASLEGIQHFRNLERLTANGIQNGESLPSNGKLTHIDLSGNPELTELNLDYQNIKEIDLSANRKLQMFGMFKSPIRNIDISSNTELTLFGTGYCQLDSIDICYNAKLDEVHLDNNKLQKIAIGKNENLRYIDLSDNLLKEVDISGCQHLQEFHCINNPYLETIYIKAGQVLSIFEYDSHVKIVAKD